MRILVTGACGASGRSLSRHLADRAKDQIFLTDLHRQTQEAISPCDLTDYPSVRGLIGAVIPDRVFHLAGTFSNVFDVDYSANVLATKHILDAILDLGIGCRVLLIGSAGEYGAVLGSDNPVREDHELRPVSVYALTKAMQTQLMRFYVDRHHMEIVMARPFNLNAKGISRKLFIGSVHAQIEEYLKGTTRKIALGRLTDKRDYIELEKATEYYELIMNRGEVGEVYNVGSGTSILMKDLLKEVLEKYGLPYSVVDSAESGRTSEATEIYADMSKTIALEAMIDH